MEQYTLMNGYYTKEEMYVFRDKITKEIMNVVLVVGGKPARNVDEVFNALLKKHDYPASMIEVCYEKHESLTKKPVTLEEYRRICEHF